MLYADKDRSVAVMDDRSAGFGLLGHGEKLHQMTAFIAFERHPEQSVGLGDRTRSTIGGDPEVAYRIEREIVRTRDGGDRTIPTAEVGARLVGVATNQEQIPAKRGGTNATVPLGDLDHVTVLVSLPGIRSIRTRLPVDTPVPVVGAGDIDLAGLRAGLDILATIHWRGPNKISCHSGEDQDLILAHARYGRLSVLSKRDPVTLAQVVVAGLLATAESRDVQVARGQ